MTRGEKDESRREGGKNGRKEETEQRRGKGERKEGRERERDCLYTQARNILSSLLLTAAKETLNTRANAVHCRFSYFSNTTPTPTWSKLAARLISHRLASGNVPVHVVVIDLGQ